MYNILMRLIKTTWPKTPGLPQAHRNQENGPSAPASQGTACLELSPLGARSEGKLCSALHEEHPHTRTHTHPGMPLRLGRDDLASGMLNKTGRGSGM